jgi:hypothetical protein
MCFAKLRVAYSNNNNKIHISIRNIGCLQIFTVPGHKPKVFPAVLPTFIQCSSSPWISWSSASSCTLWVPLQSCLAWLTIILTECMSNQVSKISVMRLQFIKYTQIISLLHDNTSWHFKCYHVKIVKIIKNCSTLSKSFLYKKYTILQSDCITRR